MKKIFFIICFLFVFLNNVYTTGKKFGPWNTKLVRVEKHNFYISGKSKVLSTTGWVELRFIRFFQIYISPQDGPNCRYRPTCSQYALLSIKKYGPILGIIMGADRFLRCNPIGAWGRDNPEDNYFFKSNSKDKK